MLYNHVCDHYKIFYTHKYYNSNNYNINIFIIIIRRQLFHMSFMFKLQISIQKKKMLLSCKHLYTGFIAEDLIDYYKILLSYYTNSVGLNSYFSLGTKFYRKIL